MFAVMYRWKLHAGSEDNFRRAWSEMTESIAAAYGTHGSRLHRSDDGEFIAYAQWPSRARWEQAQQAPSVNATAAEAMRACISERFPIVPLDVLDDLLRA